MSIEHHKYNRVRGFYTGSVTKNWPAIQDDAYNNAKTALFKDLCSDPDASYVMVEGLDKELKEHGLKYRFLGNYTVTEDGPQTSHTDGGTGKWQGDSHYTFDFEIVVTSR